MIRTSLLLIFLNLNCFAFAEDTLTPFETLQAFENIYDKMLPAQEKSDEAFAWFSGLPHPLFNAVMHLKIDCQVNEKIDALIAKVSNATPVAFWIHNQNRPTNLADVLKGKGFQVIIVCPLMSWDVKPVVLNDYRVETAKLDVFNNIIATTSHFDESMRMGFFKFLEGAETENYLIYQDEEPVGTGSVVSNGKIGGIFNVAILPEHQGKGYGHALSIFLMNRARELGVEKVVLLSSPAAEKLYSNLGFQKCFDIEIYAQ